MPYPYDDIQVQYPQNMFDGVTTNQRPYYEPELHKAFVKNAVYNNFVRQDFNNNGVKATVMHIDAQLSPQANHSPLANDQAWADTSYTDSYRRQITFKRYGGKLSLNKYDDMVSFWKQNGQTGLAPIVSRQLGPMMTQTLEKVARDAFMDSPFKFFGPTGAGSSFASIGTSDTATARMIKDIQLGLDYRENDHANNFDPQYPSVWCIASPGVIDDIRSEALATANTKEAWQDVNVYTGEGRALKLKGEIGQFYGVRFIKTAGAVLWNAGTIGTQTTITVGVSAGDGAPNPSSTAVDGIEYVGQPGAVHQVTVGTTVGFNIGDMVTIHKLRTSSFGIVNGLDYRDGSAVTLRIVNKVGTTGGTLVFDRPIMEDFLVELTAGVFGYVTKARHIHSMSFIYGDDAVVRGVQRPPEVYTPAPIDDFNQIQRFTWDAYVGYQPFNKNAFEVGFVAGSVRSVGARFIQ